MLPVILDLKTVRVGIAGAGDGLRRRLDLVSQAGPEAPIVFEGRAPAEVELSGLRVLFVAGLNEPQSADLAEKARARGVLVNVEDKPELCDFHVPAQVKRGDLLITVSTGGKSPALARAMREILEEQFGPEWAGRLDRLAALREVWRGEGLAPAEVSKRSRAFLNQENWL